MSWGGRVLRKCTAFRRMRLINHLKRFSASFIAAVAVVGDHGDGETKGFGVRACQGRCNRTGTQGTLPDRIVSNIIT